MVRLELPTIKLMLATSESLFVDNGGAVPVVGLWDESDETMLVVAMIDDEESGTVELGKDETVVVAADDDDWVPVSRFKWVGGDVMISWLVFVVISSVAECRDSKSKSAELLVDGTPWLAFDSSFCFFAGRFEVGFESFDNCLLSISLRFPLKDGVVPA